MLVRAASVAPRALSVSSDPVLLTPVLLGLCKLRLSAAIMTCDTSLTRKSTTVLITHGIAVGTARACQPIYPALTLSALRQQEESGDRCSSMGESN